MRSLLELGRLDSLETAAQSFAACIDEKRFFEPEAFRLWCRRILIDHPAKRALILPANTILDGDLYLDGETGDASLDSISTILALGNLTISGRIYNESNETGDFLLVAGDLSAFELIKGAASIVVLGALSATMTIFCDFCPGALVTGGNVTTPLLLSNDHELSIGGSVHGVVVSNDTSNMRDMLVDEVFADRADPDDEWPDGSLIRDRLAAGLPLLKPDAM